MDKTVFVTGCNARFLPSLQIWLGSLGDHKKAVSELQAIVYLMGDVSKDVEGNLKETYRFADFRRIAGGGGAAPGDFPDIWAPEHFAWKLWILKEVCGDASLAGLPLLYMDTGAMMCRWPRAWLRGVRENGVCLLEDPRQKNKQWCHDVFIQKLGVTAAELEENQLWAGAISCIIGHPLACRLFEEAWRWAQVRDVIVGAKWAGVRDGAPYGHRHDQSILSVLSSRMKIPRHPLDDVYCDVSLRQTFMSKRSLYVHRSLFQEHAPLATGIDDVWVINLDRRADRMEKFARTHPDLAQRVHRFSAFEGSGLKMTAKIARLFKPNDFKWKKPVMGCALSHLAIWMKLLNDKEDIGSYLIMEDDARLSPTWKKSWEKIHKHNALPADWDVVYLGGILPPNKEAFERSLIEPVNEYVARVKENTFFGQGKANRYMHFCAYAYVLSRRGAQKIIDVLKAKGGYWTSADHMICNIHDYMNIYFTNPLIAGCFQDDDPVYCNSQFNDFSRVDKFDSDLWNNTERFTEEEVLSALAGHGPEEAELDIMGALEDAAAAAPRSFEAAAAADPKDARQRFVSICGPPMDMSKMYEYAWFKMLFPEDKYNLEIFSIRDPPEDIPIVIVQRPYVSETADKLAAWSSNGAAFYVLHLSDEYSADRVDFYDLPGCLGVIRNYLRKDVVESAKVCVIPLGFHWAVPNCNPAVNTPRPPFREFAWSFVGTSWTLRKKKLQVLEGIPDCKSKLIFMDEWNSPNMLGREESLGLLLNSWFVPCPAGNNAETYRIYEALDAGAVPVIVKEDDCEEFLQLIGRHLPIMVCDNWVHAAQLILTLIKHVELYEQYRNSLLTAWQTCKSHVKETVLQIFRKPNISNKQPQLQSTQQNFSNRPVINVLVCICSRYPNPMLHNCIEKLYTYQINTHKTQTYKYTIHVVDSDSEDLSYYADIRKNFPDVEIHMIKNKNYEYGAWKYIMNKYPSFDIYFCIQDSMFVERYINLDILDDKNVYSFHNHSGYNSHPNIKDAGMENLKGSGLNYMPIIDKNFNLAQHSSFIVNRKILEDIFKHLTIPPINKDGSCFYERNFGIYFTDKCIRMHNLYNYIIKISFLRT
jgi:GR25 family glycosyltransferase involved in LPS biosynthesis